MPRLSVLYQENARLAATFWEWQHKTLTIFTSGVVAVLAIEAWMFNQGFGRYMAAPLIAGALLCFICVLFARRNREILNATYGIGAALEQKLKDNLGVDFPHTYAPYEWLKHSRPLYRRWLQPIFAVTAVAFVCGAIAVVAWPPHKAPTTTPPRPAVRPSR